MLHSLWTGSLFGESWNNHEEGEGGEPVHNSVRLLFRGTHCASDSDARSYWQEHWLLISLINIVFLVCKYTVARDLNNHL